VEIFKKLRSPEGDAMVMETNFFIEKMLFAGIMRQSPSIANFRTIGP